MSTMTPRQLRRMEERRLRKQNRKETNQQNAQHSTGPKTEEGKAKSSRNAVRHGLTGTFCVLPGESKEAYLLLLGELFTEHNPATATEELLVSDMARHYWLVQRAMLIQEQIMERDLNDPFVMKQLALFIRYQTTNQRAFHKCLADLAKLQKQRKKEDDGFVSQSLETSRRLPAPQAAAAASSAPTDGFVSQNSSLHVSAAPVPDSQSA